MEKENGVNCKLIVFEMVDCGILWYDYCIFDVYGNVIGKVMFGIMLLSMKIGIGMGYVLFEYMLVDLEIFIEICDKGVKVKVVKLFFYKKNWFCNFDIVNFWFVELGIVVLGWV